MIKFIVFIVIVAVVVFCWWWSLGYRADNCHTEGMGRWQQLICDTLENN